MATSPVAFGVGFCRSKKKRGKRRGFSLAKTQNNGKTLENTSCLFLFFFSEDKPKQTSWLCFTIVLLMSSNDFLEKIRMNHFLYFVQFLPIFSIVVVHRFLPSFGIANHIITASAPHWLHSSHPNILSPKVSAKVEKLLAGKRLWSVAVGENRSRTTVTGRLLGGTSYHAGALF